MTCGLGTWIAFLLSSSEYLDERIIASYTHSSEVYDLLVWREMESKNIPTFAMYSALTINDQGVGIYC